MGTALQNPAPGGVWIEFSDRPPAYITHPDHIKRVLGDGSGRVVQDPYGIAAIQQPQQANDVETELRAQIAAMQAQMAMLMAQMSLKQEAPAQEIGEPGSTEKVPVNTNSTRAKR